MEIGLAASLANDQVEGGGGYHSSEAYSKYRKNLRTEIESHGFHIHMKLRDDDAVSMPVVRRAISAMQNVGD